MTFDPYVAVEERLTADECKRVLSGGSTAALDGAHVADILAFVRDYDARLDEREAMHEELDAELGDHPLLGAAIIAAVLSGLPAAFARDICGRDPQTMQTVSVSVRLDVEVEVALRLSDDGLTAVLDDKAQDRIARMIRDSVRRPDDRLTGVCSPDDCQVEVNDLKDVTIIDVELLTNTYRTERI